MSTKRINESNSNKTKNNAIVDNFNIDYHQYDTLNIFVKKEKTATIIKCYESFNWQLVHNDENEMYSDANALIFIRPHKIKNKDYLQYNQIEMENILNDIGKCETYKHSKSTIWGLCLSLPFVLLIILSLSLYFDTKLNLLSTCISIGILLLLGIISTIFIAKVYKKENKIFDAKHISLHKKLNTLCSQVRKKGDE